MSDGLPEKMIPSAAPALATEHTAAAACRTSQPNESSARQDEPSDMELVRRFQEGDERAFDALVRRHQQRAFNIAFGLLRQREDALEVAQDAFVRAYRALKDFRGESAFTTWLYRITVNLAHNKTRWYRARHADRHMPLGALANPGEPNGHRVMDLPDPTGAPDRQAMLSEETRRVAAAMRKLAPRSREVLILRNVENLSYEEIARVLRCTLGTVKSRIARAREELRALLKETKP